MTKRSGESQLNASDTSQSSLRGAVAKLRRSLGDKDSQELLSGPSTSQISADFVITGNINCKGQAQFDGVVHGNIECNHLIVGKNGRIVGDIKAENVVIFGKVEGAIHCLHVALKSGAIVKGDVYHQGISIEMGASFMGRSGSLATDADDAGGALMLAGSTPDAVTHQPGPKLVNAPANRGQ